jgi:carboxypeptidase D
MPDNLKGLLIGNGWFSPTHQYPGYVEYAELRGFLKKKNSQQVKHVYATLERCQKDLNSTAGSHHVLVGSCEGLIEAVMQAGRSR